MKMSVKILLGTAFCLFAFVYGMVTGTQWDTQSQLEEYHTLYPNLPYLRDDNMNLSLEKLIQGSAGCAVFSIQEVLPRETRGPLRVDTYPVRARVERVLRGDIKKGEDILLLRLHSLSGLPDLKPGGRILVLFYTEESKSDGMKQLSVTPEQQVYFFITDQNIIYPCRDSEELRPTVGMPLRRFCQEVWRVQVKPQA